MTWKIRHEGSPRSIEGLTPQQVVDGLQDGLWETTDEVMGPQDPQWTAIENHPQFAEVALDIEPPPAKAHDDETRLDMNPLIDVALVLLIFFILTTSYAAIQKMLEMPKVTSDKQGAFVVSKEKAKQLTILVKVRTENGKPVIQVEDQVVEPATLEAALSRYVKDTNKTELLLDVMDADWQTVVSILDAAKGAGIKQAHFLTNPQK